MKVLFQITVLALVLTAYSQNKEVVTPSPQNSIPVVKIDSTYEVLIGKNIVYAEGLSEVSINSISAETVPLKLDAYFPNNTLENRPAIVLIHGGGFAGGTKEQVHIVNMAKYFASRGWVAFSSD